MTPIDRPRPDENARPASPAENALRPGAAASMSSASRDDRHYPPTGAAPAHHDGSVSATAVSTGPVSKGAAAASVAGLTLRIPTVHDGRPASVHAATDVTLELVPGTVHALVGESGCGKSVLASTWSGLLPPGTTVRGHVHIGGQDLTAALGRPRDPVWARLRGRVVGTVAQSAATSFTPTRTLRSQLAETLSALDGSLDADELADLVRLPRWALDAYPHEVSGGLAARAALAAALAGGPSVLVADEPTASLDPELTGQTLALLRAQADAGAAVLLITHDVAALLDHAIADTVSVMYAGRIVEQGPARTVLHMPAHAYTRALLAALPRNGLHTVPGDPPTLTDLDDAIRFEDRLSTVEAGAEVPGSIARSDPTPPVEKSTIATTDRLPMPLDRPDGAP